jgi:hypothetical protein
VKATLVLVFAVAGLAAAVSTSPHLMAAPTISTPSSRRSPFLPQPPVGPPRELLLYGHIRSLRRRGRTFELRVDPAEFLSGETANRAAIEDKVIPPGSIVPNDHYIRDPDHRLLTYRVVATAHVTVVTNSGSSGITATRIGLAELAQIVGGKNPKHRALFEPKNGFWIRVSNDVALALDQQYSP